MKAFYKMIVAAVAAGVFVNAYSKVILPSFYADNMVLQQKALMTVKGKAIPNSTVKFKASWDNKTILAKADAQGEFTIKFRVPAASMKAYKLSFSDGNGEKVLSDVYSGEVWLCSGQSNMEMPVKGWGMINENDREVADAAKYPMIRFLQVRMFANKNKPADDTELWKTWEICSPQNVEKFSALAYLFGKELYDRLRVPIGLVQSAYGGASAEAWMGLETLKTFPEMKDELEKYGKYNFVNDTIQKYAKRAEQQIPTLLYNTMLYPLHVLPVKGVIWYQGCNNVGNSNYTQIMNGLIKSWRNLWGYNFPFYYVQLAGFLKQETVQPESNWAALRWSQWKTLELPRTGMATAVDIGNEKDIHPKNKQEVARRLALLALNKTYGKKDLVCEAPAPVKYSFSEGKATLTFNNKIHVRNDSVACGFILCDANNKFVEGKAKLENPTTISITGAGLGKITAVRYDWADYPIGNIYGDTNLPVLPFRTDEMPLVNIEKK
ncbi:MAG: sialate O-acetylesterase [Prevotellaceae bacterium]|nr:sialate O-acetylesterase [Prevotellaceae bacterium]